MAVSAPDREAPAQQAQIRLTLPERSAGQASVLMSKAKRKMVKAGRQFGKTTGIAVPASIEGAFTLGVPVLYAVPTAEQLNTWWATLNFYLGPLIERKILKPNKTAHTIEVVQTGQVMIKGKTAWNADSLRGGSWGRLILDEFQLTSEDTWEKVGQPMLLKYNGDAIFLFTPPSARTSGVSRALDPLHATKMFRQRSKDITGDWECFHFTTLDNPFLPKEALALLMKNASAETIRKEIMAEDDDSEFGLLVCGAFKDETQLIEPFAIPETWPVQSFHDFGQVNEAASFVAQNNGPIYEARASSGKVGVNKGDYVVFEEYLPGVKRSTHQHIEAFSKVRMRDKVAKSIGGNHTTEDATRQGYTAEGWAIQESRCEKPKEQIDRTIALMERNRIFVFKTLLHTRAEIASMTWEVDSDGFKTGKIAHEARFHCFATWRYGFSDPNPETVASARKNAIVQYW